MPFSSYLLLVLTLLGASLEYPSAKELNEKGMDLAEINLVLLKKVEELTLYMIALKSQVDSISAVKK